MNGQACQDVRVPGWVDDWTRMTERFATALLSVEPSQWDAPTPCSDWNVRQLVEHAIDYQRAYGVYLGAGHGIETEIGDDPVAAWSAIAGALRDVYARPGVLDQSFEFLRVFEPVVPDSVQYQLIVPTLDLTMHTWDLARAIGADESLPTDICARIIGPFTAVEHLWRIPELYGPAVVPPPDADIQTQLLSFAGRHV